MHSPTEQTSAHLGAISKRPSRQDFEKDASSARHTPTRTPIRVPSRAEDVTESIKIQGRSLEISKEQADPRGIIPIKRSGRSGRTINLATNFIRLDFIDGCGIFEYDVTFLPNLDNLRQRITCLNQHRDLIGFAKMFDGSRLLLPKKLKEQNTTLISEIENDGETMKIQLNIGFKSTKPVGDPQCLTLFNVIYNRIFKELQFCPLQRAGAAAKSRSVFDPTNKKSVQRHGVEVWPGYVVGVDEYEGGVQMQVDSVSRVMRTDTVKDTITDCLKKHGPSGYKEAEGCP